MLHCGSMQLPTHPPIFYVRSSLHHSRLQGSAGTCLLLSQAITNTCPGMKQIPEGSLTCGDSLVLMSIVWARGALSPALANSPWRVDESRVAFTQLRDTEIRGSRRGVRRVRCDPVGMAHVCVPVYLLPHGPACLHKVTVPIVPFEHISPLP